MKPKFVLPVIALGVLLFGSEPRALAQPAQWEFDRAHSSIYFEIRHIYSATRGHFRDFAGTFAFDPDAPETGGCDITVQVKSIDTYLPKRDNHLRGEDFFDSAKFPTMRFKSDKVTRTADGKLALEGQLTIKDVTRGVTIPFTFMGVRENPFNPKQQVAGFEARFDLDRLEYRVGSGKYYEMGVIDKTVAVTISLEMVRPQ